MQQKILGLHKRRWITILIPLAIVLITVASWLYLTYNPNRPADLGPKLEYVGKHYYGCFLFWCESDPYSVYYFATDMSKAELQQYFRHASYIENPDHTGGGGADYNYEDLSFRLVNNQKLTFGLSYYDNTEAVVRLERLKNTNKAFVISLTDAEYKLAKQGL